MLHHAIYHDGIPDSTACKEIEEAYERNPALYPPLKDIQKRKLKHMETQQHQAQKVQDRIL